MKQRIVGPRISAVGGGDLSGALLLAGRAGGQIANGGTASGENLTLVSTAHATKGKILLGAAGASAYDEVNDRLGIGTASPAVELDVIGKLYVTQTAGSEAFEVDKSNGTAIFVASQLTETTGFVTFRNTTAASTSNSIALGFSLQTDAQLRSAAQMRATFEDITDATRTSAYFFRTSHSGTLNNPTFGVEASDAYLGPIGPSDGTWVFSMRSDGTAPSAVDSNAAGIFADDVTSSGELFGIDEAGNTPQLTPHNFELFTPDPAEPYPWSYYCKNEFLGVEIAADLTKMCRLVEALTGETIIYTRTSTPTRSWAEVQRWRAEKAIHRYERWEDRHVDDADDPEPRLPVVKDPPLWLSSRLNHNPRDLDDIRQDVEDWKDQKPGRRKGAQRDQERSVQPAR